MENNILEIVVSNPCPLAGIDIKDDYKERIDKAIKEEHSPISISYLHGILCSKMGYDIGVCLNGELCSYTGDNGKLQLKPGIYDALVIDYEPKCKAYLWLDKYNTPRGLIVDINDTGAIEYAKKCYESKTSNL